MFISEIVSSDISTQICTMRITENYQSVILVISYHPTSKAMSVSLSGRLSVCLNVYLIVSSLTILRNERTDWADIFPV